LEVLENGKNGWQFFYRQSEKAQKICPVIKFNCDFLEAEGNISFYVPGKKYLNRGLFYFY
jgi:hypothetical protein